MQLRGDKRVRKIAKQKNATQIMAITSEELNAKEACYHASCYRAYTMPTKEKLPSQALNHNKMKDSATYGSIWVICLKALKWGNLKHFKDLVETTSAKKNLKRTVETKTNKFKFARGGKELLIYPSSLSINDLVISY